MLRSPYGEGALRRLLGAGARARVSSAGFIGPDRPVPPIAVDGAATRGVDLAPHRSRLLSSPTVRDADLILVMNAQQRRALRKFGMREDAVVVLGDLDPEPIVTRAIEDPLDQPREVLDAVYGRIDRCLAALVSALGATDGPAPRDRAIEP